LGNPADLAGVADGVKSGKVRHQFQGEFVVAAHADGKHNMIGLFFPAPSIGGVTALPPVATMTA
jgi:hypothetical protein